MMVDEPEGDRHGASLLQNDLIRMLRSLFEYVYSMKPLQ